MRTNIVIDDDLMREALDVSGLKTKREVVEEGLRTLLRTRAQRRAFNELQGIRWIGDLDDMRTDKDRTGR